MPTNATEVANVRHLITVREWIITASSAHYVPLIIDGKAVEFVAHQDAVTFLQALTDTPTQTDWDERYGGYRDGEGLVVSHGIREVALYESPIHAVKRLDHERRQNALRELTPAQRKALDLPEPE